MSESKIEIDPVYERGERLTAITGIPEPMSIDKAADVWLALHKSLSEPVDFFDEPPSEQIEEVKLYALLTQRLIANSLGQSK